jgi:hypothetical protein
LCTRVVCGHLSGLVQSSSKIIMVKQITSLCFGVFLLTGLVAKAQYSPGKIFSADFYKYKGDQIRSASGKPSSSYWQNSADYHVTASFDTTSLILKGNVQIDYKNNSPDVLDELWLQLDQNITRSDSKSARMENPDAKVDESKGYSIKQVKIWNKGKWEVVPFMIEDTRMQIRLSEQPAKAGELVKVSIEYAYTLQETGSGGRSGYLNTKNGRIYEFAYWYPRMSVYDDFYGWNTLPFVGGGEMYLDYGDVDYALTVPAGLIITGAGALTNEKEVLSAEVISRLNKARQSDKTVFIRTTAELKQGVTVEKKGLVTWRFKMLNTRDVAWAMSGAYIWDAAKINLPKGKTALAQSLYPVESTSGAYAWARSTEMLKASVEHFSEKWFVFPYPVATCVAGPVGGMEFPGLAFNDWKAEPYDMYLLASHEIGHTWFPMIVGSDERRYPFMDEGFNTFIDIYAQEEFNKGEFAPKRDGEYAPGKGNPADEIIKVIEDSGEDYTLMTPADAMDYKFVHPLAYFKSAFGLVLLREVILGKDRFDYAFKQYIHNWSFKHPRPEDFFRSIENGAGEDLTWFWRGWYEHNWQLDQSIKSVTYLKGSVKNGSKVTVENKQQMVMPILVEVKEANGKHHHFTVPVEVWQKGTTTSFNVTTSSRVVSVVIDPKHQLPDTDRSNNTWK